MLQSNTIKPNLYQNSQLPLGELSSDSFEDFVYQSLVLLGEQKKFRMQSGRQPSGDEGFDCVAKTENSDLVCIQCKRYNNTLYTGTVVEEIIKVALNGVLDDSTPKYHYIITAEKVSGNLRKQLKQNNYTDLKEECKKLIDGKKLQLTLINKVKDKSIDPYNTVCTYLDSLQDLIVWSGIDFQNELIVIWSKLTDVLEKHFSLTTVFKEHPRPDFNLSDYLKKKQREEKNLIPLQFQQAPLANNLKVERSNGNTEKIVWSINDIISCLINGKNILISSFGGSGKTSTLSIIENYLLNTFNDIEYLPIKIKLRSYSRNTLKQSINEELNINYGSWKSLPFKFIFLFDALDEMIQSDTQAFIDELTNIEDYNFILTVRNSGLNIETVIPSLDYCISIQPLSYRSAFQIAEKIFQNEELKIFYNEYRSRLSSIGFNFLSLPFVLSMTIDFYKKNKNIPNKIEDILEHWIQSKIKSDASKVKDNINKVNLIPPKYIEQAFSFILYKSKIEKNLFSIPKDIFHEIILECYNELALSNSYITSCLKVDEFISMIFHYEIFILEDDSHYSTPHPIISDYLIAKEFVKNWRNHVDTLLINSLYDIWLYSSNFINEEEKKDFLTALLSFNLILAARVSKKFDEEFVLIAEKVILEYEQSEKVLKRSDAIFALGILGTEKALERLRSKDKYLDNVHSLQRLRSLALNGDKSTLDKILAEYEYQEQAPMKISGGNYDIWFKSPPSIITDISRLRLKNWIKNKSIPLCFCLKTIAFFGDSYDIDILVLIIQNTQNEKEFYYSCNALSIISNDILINLLNKIIDEKHFSSYKAKKILLSKGIKSNIDDEFNFFIKYCNKSEVELAEQHLSLKLMNLIEFIANFDLNELQIEKLIDTYKNLKFPKDFYIYQQIWWLASKNQDNKFMELVELAFSNNNSDETHEALSYLVSTNELEISDELYKKIDNYFFHIEEESFGLKFNYIKYYLKIGKNEIAYKIVFETVEKLLIGLSPETINYEKYKLSFSSTDRVFDFFNIDENIIFDDSISIKLLLIDTKHTDEYDKIKTKILSKINITKIENYAKKIHNNEVKIYVFDYMLKNHFVSNPIEKINEYLSVFLSHHVFYDTIKIVCEDNWNDELASIFLSSFLNHSWEPVSSQMFEEYIYFYAKILTHKQLIEFEQQRDKPINFLVDRIYKIWLEYNGVGNIF